MDEQGRISAAFRAAAADPPPPGFDAGDVVAASRRITRRRRAALAGAVVAVLAVAGVGTAAGFAAREPVTAAAAGAPEAASEARVAAAPEAAPDVAGGPDAGSSAGAGGRDAAAPLPGTSELASPSGGTAGPPPVGVPLGPGTRGCADRQDPALRALVEQALPEVAGAPEAATTTECRPGGERGVALEVRDGGSTGLLSVTSLPPGTAVAPAPGARAAPTASGGTVLVVARADPAGGPPPFADRLDAVVAYLAPRL